MSQWVATTERKSVNSSVCLSSQSLKIHLATTSASIATTGLVLLDTKSGRLSDKARKDLTHAFNELGLNITAQANQLSTNFLDITFDLSNGTYKPYRKPNDEPLYINRHSNHPPPIIRELPISVNKRINSLSCNKEVVITPHLCTITP